MTYWDAYRYTDPIAAALTKEFGTEFVLENTGGGCICLRAELEGGMYVLIGCAVDGPLLYDEERSHYEFQGGYGVGLYDTERAGWGGGTLAHAVDYRATTAADVIALVKLVMEMAPRNTNSPAEYVTWTRHLDGTIGQEIWKN